MRVVFCRRDDSARNKMKKTKKKEEAVVDDASYSCQLLNIKKQGIISIVVAVEGEGERNEVQ